MDDLVDIKNTQAFTKLVELYNDNTIDKTTFDLFQSKLGKVHDHHIKYMETEKVYFQHLNKLKDEDTRTLNETAVLQKQQNDINEDINRLSEECRKHKVELSEYENTRLANKRYEIEQKKENIEELNKRILTSEQEQIEKLRKENDEIREINKKKLEEVDMLEKKISDYEQQYREISNLKDKIDFHNEQKKKNNIESLELIARKKNEIENERKTRHQGSVAEIKLKKDNSIQNDIKSAKEAILNKIKEENNNLKFDIDKLMKETIKNENELKECKSTEEDLHGKISKVQNELKSSEDNKLKLKNNLTEINRIYNSNKLNLDTLRHQYDESIKTLKDKESELGKTKTIYQEEVTDLKRRNQMKAFYLSEIKRVNDIINKISREVDGKKSHESDKKDLINEEENVKKSLEEESNNLDNLKKNLLDKVDQLKDNIDEMKNLRETIQRTVQRLDESTRQINEEIQVKELIYLDMTKRNEELKSMYQKYHLLYETVLAERNKNVVKIQNANQRRAEIKEKMRIITTEMDILQSELNEINNKLSDKQKELNKIKQQQNALKQEINNLQYLNKNYEEEIKKLTNENEKLHSIMNNIESDMVTLRVNYEIACESRNYTGIQLIDRNDELCIFYEKIQHLESEISTLFNSILEKESKLQKLVVDNNEVERFIEVNRKKIPQIPELSNKIKELDNELKILNKTLENLIKYIESPDNNLKNELPGEDPDIDYLKMRYDQLSDMLNEKKELLLEKELINEEINQIADKLRTKALDDREKNIDISEKMNEYEMKLNDITRKNIAFTSELSMFRAILYKLEKTKEEKENLHKEASDKLDNNLPPTKDCIKKFETMMKLSSQKKDYFERRRKAYHEKDELPIEIPLRKRAAERPTQYIDAKTGLYKAYGKYAPFDIHPNPPNMRHFRNPKERSNEPPGVQNFEPEFNKIEI